MANSNAPSFVFKPKSDYANNGNQNQTGFGQTTPYSRASNKTQTWGTPGGSGFRGAQWSQPASPTAATKPATSQPSGNQGRGPDGWPTFNPGVMGQRFADDMKTMATQPLGGKAAFDLQRKAVHHNNIMNAPGWGGLEGAKRLADIKRQYLDRGDSDGMGHRESNPWDDAVYDARFTNSQISRDRAAEYENNGELREQMKQYSRPGISLGASALNRATAPVARSIADVAAIGPSVMAQHDLANRANYLTQQEIQGQAAFQNAQVNQQLAANQNANALAATAEQNRLMQMMMNGLG